LVEPRFSWARIAAAEVELTEQKFFEAERHLLAAQQFANFPTLSFTLGKVYLIVEDFDGAAEQFAKAFKYAPPDKFTTRLGGVRDVQADELKELFAPEHQAAIFLADPPTSDELFKIAEALTRTNGKLEGAKPSPPAARELGKEAGKGKESKLPAPPEPEGLEQAVNTFVDAEASRRSFRALYMAHRLAQAGQALPLAVKLADRALELADVATEAEGSVYDVPNYDREGRLRLFRGRALDAKGWALFKANRNQAALIALSDAVMTYGPLPEVKQALRHLAAAQETAGNLPLALEMHLAAYEPPDDKNNTDVNRTVIELLYRKVHGSLDGLREKLGQPLSPKTTELITNTARLAVAPKPAETLAQAADTEPAKQAPAQTEFNVNQLLANKSAEPARPNDTRATDNQVDTRRTQTAPSPRRPPTTPDPGTKDPVRLGLYGIPVNPNTPRISTNRPATMPPAAPLPASTPVKKPDAGREVAQSTVPANPAAEDLAEVGKELAPAPHKMTSADPVKEITVPSSKEARPERPEETAVRQPVELAPPPANTSGKSVAGTTELPVAAAPVTVEPVPAESSIKLLAVADPNKAAQSEPKPGTEPESQPIAAPEKTAEAKPAAIPVQLPELNQQEVPILPSAFISLLAFELSRERLDLPALDEPVAPPTASSLSVHYEDAPAKAAAEPAAPAPTAITRPRRVSELIPVNEPAPATRKRRVTSPSPKP
jgi:hypothetical protein